MNVARHVAGRRQRKPGSTGSGVPRTIRGPVGSPAGGRRDRDDRTLAGAALRSAGPVATAARYDRRIGRIVITLSSGLDVAVRPRDLEGLQGARPGMLEPIEITPSGLGLHFPKLDADAYLPALLEGVFGTRRFMRERAAEAV